MNKDNTNIAGVVFTFSRHYHTYKFLKSLKHCIDIDDIDWIFFQDGAVNKFSNERITTDKNINRNLKILKNINLPNKELRVNEYNIGIGLQVNKMFNLFNEGYDLILFFENDIRLSKYGIRIFRILMNQFNNSVTSIYRKLHIDEIPNYKNKLDVAVEINEPRYSSPLNLHTFGIWEKEFRKIENEWNDFIDIIKDIDYRYKPNDQIKYKFNSNIGSNDWVIKSLLDKNNIRGVLPLISRASYMGIEGINSHKHGYFNALGHGYKNEGYIEHKEDANINKFKLHNMEDYQ